MHIQTMARYNRWMNRKIYACCASLPEAERLRDRGAFFKSIHGTLNHLLLADRVWMGRFTAQPFAVRSLDQVLYADFAELRRERVAEDERIVDWISALTEHDVDRELVYTSLVHPQPRRYPLQLALAHFFNHQTHHRGQITTLLSQSGVDVGVTDLIALPAEEA